ncbi:MAG: ATP-dependent RNA helicase HrpA [Phycisphaerales bacterium]|jgi:ATP-dependent helicase HrpA|nr:ATP-dependent RNA helicase HrpA [Phycisphaerales bacterium]
MAEQFAKTLIVDRRRFKSRLGQLASKPRDDAGLETLKAEVAKSMHKVDARRRSVPRPAWERGTALDLPVLARREEIASVIAKHQVCVICGETGSGKTTQLPQICLSLGRGVHGTIGHTQPRRLAARSVAQRIADELDTSLGPHGIVGYKVRFGDETSDRTLVKLMTDGILLAEIQSDRDLLAYDTIIIDEAHERSLNIDFLLGYLRQLLPRRPDLKVIVTSATIDPQRLSAHFGGPEVCPVVEVSGRTYPVEIRYKQVQDVDDDFEESEEHAILDAMTELSRPGMVRGDILVFLPGEREIRLEAEHLRKHTKPGEFEILPLFSRLSAADQQKIFAPHGTRRIVLATNVAETSLTVPGIKYVIDSGLARISRYSHRTKVQRLPIESISQASANQRAGRCGRVSEGVCIRLYTKDDFDQRPAFTDPEILRTNLASVILQMKSLRLGPIEEFPFVEPPDARMIRDGYDTLIELGAIDEAGELTPIGKRLARLPIDVRLGRMLLAAEEEGALDDVIVIAAVLSSQDPRDRPMEKAGAADLAHSIFKAEGSDFLGFVAMWDAYQKARDELSHGKLRTWCRERFLNFNRMREWEEMVRQLRGVCEELKLDFDRPIRRAEEHAPKTGKLPVSAAQASSDAIHRALLAGLLSNVLYKDPSNQQGELQGARGNRAFIFPGSALFKKNAQWLMAAEIVATTKLYARTCGKIEPQWLEKVGAHALKKSHTDVHFVAETGQVCAWERVTMFGLVIVPRRRVPYGPINMGEAREVFIHDGLVDGQFRTNLPFAEHNALVIDEARALEAKLRRTDIWAEIDARYEYFDKHIPPDVWNKSTFEHWYRQAVKLQPDLLCMKISDVLREGVDDPDHTQFPAEFRLPSGSASIDYVLDPGKEHDGLTLNVPVESLAQLDAEKLEWLVPGMLEEKVHAMLKTLPKQYRTQFVGTKSAVSNAHADEGSTTGGLATLAYECAGVMVFAKGSINKALSEAVEVLRHVHVPDDAWQLSALPTHLRMNIRVIDESAANEDNRKLGEGRDVEELKKRFASRARRALAGMARQEFGKEGITTWDFGELPEKYETTRAGSVVIGYPTLVDMGESVTLTLAETAAQALRQMRRGVIRLLVLQCKDELAHRIRALSIADEMFRFYGPLGDAKDLKADVMDLIVEKTFLHNQPAIRSKDEFDARLMAQWGRLGQHTKEVAELVHRVLAARHKVAHRLGTGTPRTWELSVTDLREQAAYLLPPGVFKHLPLERLVHYPRYAEGMHRRLEKMREDGTSRESRVLSDVQTAWKRMTAWISAAHTEAKKHAEEDNQQPSPSPASGGKPKAALPGAIGKRAKVVIASDAAAWFAQALGDGRVPPDVEAYRWQVEEFRVSVFAQELGTVAPVSTKRLEDAWAKIKP